MAAMARDTVSEIKERLTITDVVGAYVKLKKAGRSYTGLCPFHKEKTPSFHVSLERGSWHCFGCGEGGDAFSFVEKIEGVDFKGALKILAEKAGVTIEYSGGANNAKEKERGERLRDAMARARQFYAGKLEGTAAYDYARKRGLTPETIAAWELGYAPDDWRELFEHLTAAGFAVQELLDAGLIKEAEGKSGTYYDRFRNRLMFPIRDSAGRVVAFTGRALAAEEPAKYLNSPETDLYHKSEVLFGFDRAKDAIRTRGFMILVEGQMDLLHAHQAGFTNTVALSGTALTERHLSLVKRYSENLMLALDADTAGLSATLKAALMALKNGMKVKAIRLPIGQDPADVISADANDFAKRSKESKPVAEFFLAVLAERERDPHRLVQNAEKVVLPLIAAMPSPLEREHLAGVVARGLGLSKETILEGVKKASRAESAAAPPASARSQTPVQPRVSREEILRAAVVVYPDTPLAKHIENEYSRIVGVALVPGGSEAALFEAERTFGAVPKEQDADDLVRAFEEAYIREAHQEAVERLRRAEHIGSSEEIKEAQAACAELSAKLAALH